MTVALWFPGATVPAVKTLLYKRDDEVAFGQQAKSKIAPGTSVYKVLPNGYPFLELLRLYLHHLADSTDAWLDQPSSIPVDHIWIARNLVRLKVALSTWDDRGATAALVALEKHQGLLHPDQIQFVEFCKGFVTRLVQPFLWGSPLTLTTTTVSKARTWWLLKSDLSLEAAQQLHDLRSRFQGSLPRVLQDSFYRWLTTFQSWLDTKLFVTNQSDALREASALCHALAVIHFGLRRHSLALLYCHRATDLLLFSECAAQGLVNFTANNGAGALSPPVGQDTMVTLLNCHDSLVANQKMLLNAKRLATFKDLNNQRNLLLMTHHLGAVPSAIAGSLLNDVGNELRAIGGSGWQASSVATRSLLKLDAHQFFELSAGLMGTLVPD